jgi:hypothetical protein
MARAKLFNIYRKELRFIFTLENEGLTVAIQLKLDGRGLLIGGHQRRLSHGGAQAVRRQLVRESSRSGYGAPN